MGFVLISLNWHQMCLNHIYCSLFKKFMIFTLTTNAIIVFILYLYLCLLKSLYLLEFIVVSILFNWTVLIQFVFLLYLLEMYLFSFISVLYIFIHIY